MLPALCEHDDVGEGHELDAAAEEAKSGVLGFISFMEVIEEAVQDLVIVELETDGLLDLLPLREDLLLALTVHRLGNENLSCHRRSFQD